MSGGHFEYNQYRINDVVDSIEELIQKNGRLKTKEEKKDEGWYDPDFYEKYPEENYHTKYSDKVIEEFKKAVFYLKKASIYTQRIDWFISGDDSEESFHERLKEELENEK